MLPWLTPAPFLGTQSVSGMAENSRHIQESPCWGLCTGTGTVAPSHGPAHCSTDSLTHTRGLWCCQGPHRGSAMQGSIPKACTFLKEK